MTRLAILVLAALAVAGPARAQAPNPIPSNRPMALLPNAGTPLLLERLTNGATLESFLNLARSDFRNLDANSDDKLTPMDAEIHKLMQQASNRFIYAMMIFRADLDGDGMVTAEESSGC